MTETPTPTTTWETLELDQTVALRTAATRLARDACPIFPGKRYEEWVLDDPAGLDVAAVRPIRDEIERRVRTLLESLNVMPGG